LFLFKKEKMMKKLLALMLVLGMASFANAAITISVNGSTTGPDVITIGVSDTVTIDIWNQGGSQTGNRNYIAYLDFFFVSDASFTLSSPRLGAAAGDFPASFIMTDQYIVDGMEYEFPRPGTQARPPLPVAPLAQYSWLTSTAKRLVRA